jgi:hypothetical protein
MNTSMTLLWGRFAQSTLLACSGRVTGTQTWIIVSSYGHGKQIEARDITRKIR